MAYWQPRDESGMQEDLFVWLIGWLVLDLKLNAFAGVGGAFLQSLLTLLPSVVPRL